MSHFASSLVVGPVLAGSFCERVSDRARRHVVARDGGRWWRRGPPEDSSASDAGATVRVVAREVGDALAWVAADDPMIQLTTAGLPRSATRGRQLVIAATADSSVNDTVARNAKGLGILVNVVDAPERGDFVTPAVHRVGMSSSEWSPAGSPRPPRVFGMRSRASLISDTQWPRRCSGSICEMSACGRQARPMDRSGTRPSPVQISARRWRTGELERRRSHGDNRGGGESSWRVARCAREDRLSTVRSGARGRRGTA